ncbi:MAG: zinc ABC transporter substrate-binding protein [Gammaproteobacteria bacterium]|jgi:zinc/manganese transport system substrate-binding protein|nr:MAG: zinc ABC transporter substrate-binding protein [Gammaproteobacteria bacterium]
MASIVSSLLLKASLLFLVLATLPHNAQAHELNVVASSSSTGALVREVGGAEVKLTILAPPDRDLHYLQARPGMMRALRGADLVTSLGADLEIGWLPVAIRQAANPDILPGRPGYFEAAAFVTLKDAHGIADRALGDVHPLGNPHINMDPLRMTTVAHALAARLGALDPENADLYATRAAGFESRVQDRMKQWRASIDTDLSAVLYHRDAAYLLDLFDIPLLGLLEPVPGVPPSGAHIRSLTQKLTGIRGVIFYTPYQSENAPQTLAKATGWRTEMLPLEPALEADGEGYLLHLDRWIAALSGAAP